MVRTTSTNFITGTGLKKCSPTNRCGRFVAVAISVIVNEDVLLAKIVVDGQIASSAPNSSRFAGSCSMIASTMTSQFFKSSMEVVPFNLPWISPFTASLIVPFSTRRFRFFSIPLSPFSTNSALTSRTTVSNPAATATCAIPEPIKPHPTTPTFRIAMLFLVEDFAEPSAKKARQKTANPERKSVAEMAAASCSAPPRSSQSPALRRCTPSPAHTATHSAAAHSKS